MSELNDYNKHTFLSRVLGNASSNSNSNPASSATTNNLRMAPHNNNHPAPFLDDDNMDLQFTNTYSYLDKNNEKVKNMLMSEVSLNNGYDRNNDFVTGSINNNNNNNNNTESTPNGNGKRKLRSNISINFNSESESSEDDNDNNSDDDYDNDDGYENDPRKNDHKTNILKAAADTTENTATPKITFASPYEANKLGNTKGVHGSISNAEKNQLREEIKLELELEHGEDEYIPESLLFENTNKHKQNGNLFNKIEQSLIFQVKEVERTFGPTINNFSQTAKSLAHKTMETSVMQPPAPNFLSNKKKNSSITNLDTIQRQVFNARRLPAKERALWMWANVTNLDIFLNDVYDYYIGNGWNCIALSKICDLLIITFVIWLTSFMGNCIDYNILLNQNVSKLSQVYDGKCYAKIPLSQKCFYFVLIVLLFLRIKNCYRELVDLKEIKLFYNHLLSIDDSELQTISWPHIVKKIMILKGQNTNAIINNNKIDPDNELNNDLKSKSKLNAYDIANRLMRKENYMIAIFNKNLLNKPLTIPIFNTYFLTNTLEWNLKLCIFDFLFNDEGQLRRKVLSQHHRLSLITQLKKRFRIAGLLSIFLTPFLVIYFILYYFLKLFYDFKTNPGLLNARSYSPYAKWKMREYNELPHLFDQRINLSVESADDYLNQFPKELINIVLKFISYITGSIVTILVILTIIDHENFLNFELTEGRTVLFYMSTLGALFTICKNSISNQNNKYLFDPELSLKKVSQYTHYLPKEWENRYHTQEVKNQFSELYNLKLVLMFRELCSLILLPYILYISLPNSADKLIDFFRDFSVHVDGIGYVCTFAMFNLNDKKDHYFNKTDVNNKNFNYDKDDDDDDDNKMVKSYLYFVDSYGGNGVTRDDAKDVNEVQNLVKRTNNNNLLRSAIFNNKNSMYSANGNGGISIKNGKLPIYQEQMEETNAGLFNPNTRNYVDDLSNTMMLGESYQMGYGKSNALHIDKDNDDCQDKDGTNSSRSGGVLGLINHVYQHKRRVK